ncbi:MAG: ThiF family adenylyltransferase [Magnetococcales bacterium]|nr:ThiF family adenylyltransferase [Magnetococcales bacterium]
MDFTEKQVERYSRQMMLHDMGGTGQSRLLAATIMLLGLGAMGSVAALYLAAAGVGRMTLVDHAPVLPTTPGRESIHTRQLIGVPKTVSAHQAICHLNPDVQVTPVTAWLAPHDPIVLPEECHLLLDCSNQPSITPLLDRVCRERDTPLIIARWQAQFGGVLMIDKGGPTLAHMETTLDKWREKQGYTPGARQDILDSRSDEPPPLGSILAGLVANVAATEAIKRLVGLAPSDQTLLVFDALTGNWEEPCVLC